VGNSRLSIAVSAAFFFALFLLAAARARAVEDESETPITFEQCRDQLMSGDFVVVDERKDLSPQPHVALKLARAVQDMIDRKGSKDETKARERFDRLHDEVIRRILENKWGFDETSENILDDCHYAFHPEADPSD
jgi:hypothetical protein